MSPEAERVRVVLRSLAEPSLKLAFLRGYVGPGDAEPVARTLDEICASAARVEEAAREPVLAIAMFLASAGEDSVTDRLGRSAAQLGLGNLGRLLRRAPELEAELGKARVPDYGIGREPSLGERRSLARAPNRRLFDKLIRDPHPLVITRLLENPLLTEADVIRLAALRPAHADALRAIARTPWLCRPRVRMAVILNPGTPSAVAVPLIAACTRPELVQIKKSTECSAAVRETALELLKCGEERAAP